MRGKRQEASDAREAARRAARPRQARGPAAPAEIGAPAVDERTARTAAQMAERQEEDLPDDRDVIPWLRQLGFQADEARRAAARCDAIPHASLEERVRLALRHLTPPHRRVAASLPAPA